MRSIWKYPLGIVDGQTIPMPAGAVILDVQVQYGEVYLWALVKLDEPLEERKIFIFGTGHQVPSLELEHLGTFQLYGGDFVGHVFEAKTQ